MSDEADEADEEALADGAGIGAAGTAVGAGGGVAGAPGAEPLRALLALLATAAPAAPPGEVPAWAQGNRWLYPLSFKTGMRHESAPAKPIAEQTTADRMATFLASVGRRNTPRVW
jgi:hypothetical protein